MSSINNKIAKLSPKKLKVRNRLKNKSIKDYEFPPVSRLILLYLTSVFGKQKMHKTAIKNVTTCQRNLILNN